jgi:hypothetical protein
MYTFMALYSEINARNTENTAVKKSIILTTQSAVAEG